MRVPKKILMAPNIEPYCKKRQIWDSFLKAKNNILAGYVLGGSQMRIREPRSEQKRYFRINKQYRAIGIWDGEIFLILAIDDHQS